MTRLRVSIVTFGLAAFIAQGCGASGASHALGSAPQAQPSTPSTQAPGTNATFVIQIPSDEPNSKKRRPLYVSPSTQSLAIITNSGSPAVSNLTPTSPGCVAATQTTPLTCSIAAAEPVGSDTFVLTTYDKTGGTGNVLSTATVQATIVVNQANNVSVTLNGVVDAIDLSLGEPNPPMGAPATIPLSVNALDADGNVISPPGIYVSASGSPIAISLSDSDSTYTSLSQTSVTAPNAGVTVSYNGGNLTSATISATASGIASNAIQDAVLSPGPASTPTPAPVPTSLSLEGSGNAQTFSVSEPNYTGTFTATSTNGSIATVATSDGINFTVTGGADSGSADISVTDSFGNATNIPVSNTITNVNVN